jgi:hypothetical protein
MKRRTLLQNLVSSMVAAPVLSAYWKKSATNSSRAALRVIGMRCFSFDVDIPLTLYSFCGMGG